MRTALISILLAFAFAVGLAPPPPAFAQDSEPLSIAGEYLGFHYAMEEFNETFCGPIVGGPYGAEHARTLLEGYLSDTDMAELNTYIDQNFDKDHAYFRGILNENFRKRRGTSDTLDDVCAEFEPIYRNLFKEAEDAVRALGRR